MLQYIPEIKNDYIRLALQKTSSSDSHLEEDAQLVLQRLVSSQDGASTEGKLSDLRRD